MIRRLLGQHLETRDRISPGVVSALLLLAMLIGVDGTMAGDYGTITGTVLSKETGEPIIGAAVMIDGTSIGTSTDLDGYYVIRKVPAGTHTLKVNSISFDVLLVEEVEVVGNETVSLDLTMTRKVVETDKKIVVTAKMLQNTEASLLKVRQKSISVSDAIGSEGMSRSGSSDAAEAVKRVPGASLVGGKFVYIRGLGGRYSSSKLNGVTIPGTDPDGHAVEMNLFPTYLLDLSLIHI